MDPEYISKTGYDARAGAELTRNSIQMTDSRRMDTCSAFPMLFFENMKRVQEATAINEEPSPMLILRNSILSV